LGCDLQQISNYLPAVKICLINLWLLGEEFKLIIIRDAGGVIQPCPWHDIPTVFQVTEIGAKLFMLFLNERYARAERVSPITASTRSAFLFVE